MLKVIIRFDTVSSEKTTRLEGYTKHYPEINKEFSIEYMMQATKINIDLGRVFNIEPFGDMLLIQTQYVVAEVWIISGEEEKKMAEVLPFVNNYNTLYLKGRKITNLNHKNKAASKIDLIKLNSLIKFMKEKADVYNDRFKPQFNLIK